LRYFGADLVFEWFEEYTLLDRYARGTSPVRRHLSYANVAATLALILSMSGGALAASRYLINSTKQINPVVLKALRGNTGPSGARGAKGQAGVQGIPGEPGGRGPRGERGVRGERGEPGEPSPAAEGGAVGYSAFFSGPAPVPTSLFAIGYKTLPAGHYIVSAKIQVSAQSAKAGAIAIHCVLSDEGTTLDQSYWYGSLTYAEGNQFDPYLSVISIPLDGALTTVAQSKVGIECQRSENSAEAEPVSSAQAEIDAVQTSANR
jgi:hypothetical protein